jgi:hypothetical protein
MNQKTRAAWIVQGIGAVIAVIGGILAVVGTTSTGLFIFYCVLFLGGLLLILAGRKMYSNSLKE